MLYMWFMTANWPALKIFHCSFVHRGWQILYRIFCYISLVLRMTYLCKRHVCKFSSQNFYILLARIFRFIEPMSFSIFLLSDRVASSMVLLCYFKICYDCQLTCVKNLTLFFVLLFGVGGRGAAGDGGLMIFLFKTKTRMFDLVLFH